MDAQQKEVARNCLAGAYSNTMSFPDGVRALAQVGFEGYHVDYRVNTRTHYLPTGETLVLDNPGVADAVGPQFDQPEIADAVQWARINPPDYNYIAFNKRVTAHGCAGYIVSILGRRVLYFGRTAETHVEHFPT